jgi:uncharacterized protein (TIGR00369 family)
LGTFLLVPVAGSIPGARKRTQRRGSRDEITLAKNARQGPTSIAGRRATEEGAVMTEGGVGELNREQLDRLANYFDEAVTFSRHIRIKVEDVEPGYAVLYIDVEDVHFNGNGSLHGGVYTSLIDNAMGLSVSSLVGLRTATVQMDAHFLGPVSEGRITCRGEVVHRTRRTATAEGRVYDQKGNLVAMGTGVFRIFEKEGNPIV